MSVMPAPIRLPSPKDIYREVIGKLAPEAVVGEVAIDWERWSHVAMTLRLNTFEQEVLALAMALEIEPSLRQVLYDQYGSQHLTAGICLALLNGPSFDAFAATSSLRRWNLIDVKPGTYLSDASVRLDETTFYALTGSLTAAPILVSTFRLAESNLRLSARDRDVAGELSASWQGDSAERYPIVELTGGGTADRLSVAVEAARLLRVRLWTIPSSALPNRRDELGHWAMHLDRDSVFWRSALAIEMVSPDHESTVADLLERVVLPTVILTDQPTSMRIPRTRVDMALPSFEEVRQQMTDQLGLSDGLAERAAATFRVPDVPAGACKEEPWAFLRRQARADMGGLAERVDGVATFDDLILPANQIQALRDLADQVRFRGKVLHRWGFGGRGTAATALFAGPSGTGKTLAAEVLGNELELDVFRIDLATVVSKYIGETEKNLRRVFDAAEGTGAILLFDEADALFGKRSEVKDSHDRYANIEVSYLLQRMESYSGIAILTTNLKSSLDTAFLRRLRFVVNFPFPDRAHREAMWRRALPDQAPRHELDYGRLANLNVTGGNIRNIALGSAFLAAASGTHITMATIKRAAIAEFIKLDRQVNESEVADWA